jgi:hypothetical protein
MKHTIFSALTALALFAIPVALSGCDEHKTETKKETTTTTAPADQPAPPSQTTTTTTTTDKKD